MQKVRQTQHVIPCPKRQAVVHVIQFSGPGGETVIICDQFTATSNVDGTWKVVANNVPMRLEDNVFIRGKLTLPRAAIKITSLPEDDDPDATIWMMEVDI